MWHIVLFRLCLWSVRSLLPALFLPRSLPRRGLRSFLSLVLFVVAWWGVLPSLLFSHGGAACTAAAVVPSLASLYTSNTCRIFARCVSFVFVDVVDFGGDVHARGGEAGRENRHARAFSIRPTWRRKATRAPRM